MICLGRAVRIATMLCVRHAPTACATGALITVISEHSQDNLICRSAGARGLALSALLALPLTGACIA